MREVFNVSRFVDELAEDLKQSRINETWPATIRINPATAAVLMVTNPLPMERLTNPATLFGIPLEVDLKVPKHGYKLKYQRGNSGEAR